MAAAIERCDIATILTSQHLPQESRPRADAGHGLSRRPPAEHVGRREGRDARRGAAAARARSSSASSSSRPGAECARHHHLLQRQHRRAEGRDAHASQRAGEHRRRGRALQADAGRRRARRAAVLSLLRVHRHALAAARRRLRRGLPSEPDRREDDRRARRALQRDAAHQHADLLRVVRAQVPAASSSRTCGSRSSAPSGCASRSPPRSRRSSASSCSKATAAPRWRRSWRSTCRTSTAGERQRGAQRGSVGRPLPGVAAMVVDPDTGEGPLIGKEGLLLVNGPNRMLGYLGEPELTSEAFRDGWYVTGDIATIDEAGFIRITDRLSRFSKIAGEMVPHMKIEEQIQALLADPHTCVVTAVPDRRQGRAARRALHRSRAVAAGRLGTAVPHRICRSCGCRSARTSASSNRSRRSAPARSTCAPCVSSALT